jgi:hypothetical protein
LWLSFLSSSNLSCVATKKQQTSNEPRRRTGRQRDHNSPATTISVEQRWTRSTRSELRNAEKVDRAQIYVPFAVALSVWRVSPPSSAAKGRQDRELSDTSSDVSADQARTRSCSQRVHLQVVHVSFHQLQKGPRRTVAISFSMATSFFSYSANIEIV